MRATFTANRFVNKYNSNNRRYGKRSSSNELTNAVQSQPEKPKNLVAKFVSLLKTWTQQFQAKTSTAYDNPASQPGKEGQQILKSIAIKRNHSTQPEMQELQANDVLETAPDLYPKEQPSPITSALITPSVDVTQKQDKPMALGFIKITEMELPVLKRRKELQPYPVVPLQETLDRYLNSLRPLFKEAAFQRELEITVDFLRNEGDQLQALLEAVARNNDNWLSSRWTKVNYLRHRAPLTLFSSPCLTFPPQNFANYMQCLDFTARTIYAMCEFKQLVDSDQIPRHNADGPQLDHSHFKKIFGTVRVPLRGSDALEQCNSNYVIVINKNNFYKLTVYTEGKAQLGVQQIKEQLVKLIRSKHTKGPAFGLLSHDRRDNWAEAHEMLCRKELNTRALQCIQKALFTVCLDEGVEMPAHQARSVLATQLLHGGGTHQNSANRWMDKTLQLIVNPMGMAGFCLEHSPAELQPAVTLMDYVLKNICKPGYGNKTNVLDMTKYLRHVQFAEIDECIGFWLRTAKRNMTQITGQFQVHAFKFDSYGSALIRSSGLAPDSYIQMALQLAFYRQHKHLPAQQESAQLHIFKGGRSEVIRSTSIESWKFVRGMILQKGTDKQRLLALNAAIVRHQEQTKLALQGRAVDRHLFGLLQMANEHEIALPHFFQSEGYLKSRNFRIVSSPLSTPHDAFMAYGPLNKDGYGCCYNLRESDIIFAVSAWNDHPQVSANVLGTRIESALNDMGQLLLSAGHASGTSASCKQ